MFPFSLREYRPLKEEKDMVEQFGSLFAMIDAVSFGEIIGQNIDLLVRPTCIGSLCFRKYLFADQQTA